MINPFLSSKNYDTDTAMLLETAIVHDLNTAVAYTDGDAIYVNTPDNLFKLLPKYNNNILKWILWHEKMHIELGHPARFFAYQKHHEKDMILTQAEVNIIMDILVHDSLLKMFPDIVEEAEQNPIELRDRNSLSYTFKTRTLEKMLTEYNKFKKKQQKDTDKSKKDTSKSKNKNTDKSKNENKKSPNSSNPDNPDNKDENIKTKNTQPAKDQPSPTAGRHQDVDWSKQDNINKKEFITRSEGIDIQNAVRNLKRTKVKLAQLTKTLNGLITDTPYRTYKSPSNIITGQNTIFKGHQKTKASLYLCFDASGSMGEEMNLFKEIITHSIPQALQTPTKWFSGERSNDSNKTERLNYYKGSFKDFLPVLANGGYSDDGDRTIEMCYEAEQEGYSPIGITDGGGKLSWSKEYLMTLKRTILIIPSYNQWWGKEVQLVNPHVQIIVL